MSLHLRDFASIASIDLLAYRHTFDYLSIKSISVE